MKEIGRRDNGALFLDNLTVTGENIGERIAGASIKDETIIHTLENPY